MTGSANAVAIVADLMALSARTAPKARGTDALVIKVYMGADLARLATEMKRIGETLKAGFFIRDAANIENSEACVVIGSQKESTVGLDCGGCGFETCGKMLEAQGMSAIRDKPFSGPNCVVRMADLGIALGSAVKTAAIHNVDNRIMYSAGVAACSLGWLENCGTAYGIPLKGSGKNIYFDRTG